KIRTIIILPFLLILVVFITSGCLPEELNFFSSSGETLAEEASSPGTEEEADEGSDFDVRLNELKDRIVSPPVIISHDSDEVIFGSGDKELIFIEGRAEPKNTIEVYVNSILKASDIIVDNSGYFKTPNGVEIIEGKNVVEAIAINPAGNKSDPTKFNLFLNVPDKVKFSIYEDAESLKEITGVYYSTEHDPRAYLRGHYTPNSYIFIQANDKIVGEMYSDINGIFALDEIELREGENEIGVWAITPDGFVSAPVFSNISVLKDLITPGPSNLTGYKSSNANYLSWNASVDDNFDSYKIVRVEDPCKNPDYPEDDIIVTISDKGKTSYIDQDIESGRSYYYTVWTIDKAGHAVSSNVLAVPKPVYGISIVRLEPLDDNVIGRREWFYQYYEITNTGNVTVDLQPMMVWLKLNPEPDGDMEIAPLWEVHIWNPESPGIYYYSNESIYETYIADWANTSGYTTVEEQTVYSDDGLTKTVTVVETTRETDKKEVNLKRIVLITTETTITETNLETGDEDVKTTTDTSTAIAEPEKIGTPIEDLEPGEKIKIGIKIQNISADVNEEIVVHFHFAPVDCDGHFFIDEIVSTNDIYCSSSGRN
ncbi:MAG: hypothetical protein JW770_03795, partial [Actinobacteria bacterium]|nr:hypothetical protein [Actinomycetota bacterium]